MKHLKKIRWKVEVEENVNNFFLNSIIKSILGLYSEEKATISALFFLGAVLSTTIFQKLILQLFILE
jgi:hypothetical protein